jgi:hypothetical protein
VPAHYRVVSTPVRAVVRSCHSSTTPTGPINDLSSSISSASHPGAPDEPHLRPVAVVPPRAAARSRHDRPRSRRHRGLRRRLHVHLGQPHQRLHRRHDDALQQQGGCGDPHCAAHAPR